MDGDVRMRYGPGSDDYSFAHWSHVGHGAPWRRTNCWAPTETDRIAALEQRVAELEARASEQMGLMARLSLSTAEAFESLRADR